MILSSAPAAAWRGGATSFLPFNQGRDEGAGNPDNPGGFKTAYLGQHYTVEGTHLLPGPVQRPRIPVWIGGDSPAALRRAARWDGWVIGAIDEQCNVTKSPWLEAIFGSRGSDQEMLARVSAGPPVP